MAETITAIIDIDVDLDSGAKPVPLSMQLVYGNKRAHTFRVRAYREGTQVYMSGVQAIGYVRRADGTTIELTGVVSLDMVEVTLTEACYAVTGLATISIDLVIGDVIATCMVATAQVDNVKSDYAVSPGSGGSTVVVTGAVRYDITQVLTEDQKARARANIGAGAGSESGGSIAGAVRFDIEQGLEDAQKAQARANIGVTSTGADISGIIDDDLASTENSSEKVWSSRKSSVRAQVTDASIGTLSELDITAENLVDAINKVNSKIGSGTGNIPTHVNARGDSLTLGAGTTDANGDGYSDYDTHSYPALLAKKINMPVYNYGAGGETVATILGREGSVPMVADSLYISGSTTRAYFPPEVIKSITGEEAKPLLQRARIADVNPCYIAGIKGTLDYHPGDETSDPMYSFAREESGDAANLRGPVIIQTQQMRNLEPGQIPLLWMGHNNINTDLDDDIDAFADYLIERHKTAIEYERPAGYIILAAPVTNKTASSAEKYKPIHEHMQAVFGIHYLNIVDYLIKYGVYDAQAYDNTIELTEDIIQDMGAYRIPSVLRAPDGVHLNGMGYQLVADQVYKRGQLLGYWT